MTATVPSLSQQGLPVGPDSEVEVDGWNRPKIDGILCVSLPSEGLLSLLFLLVLLYSVDRGWISK